MKLFISPQGTLSHLLHEEDPELLALLPPVEGIRRFSNVDPMRGSTDWYIWDVPTSPPIGPFSLRKEALNVEREIAEDFLRSGSRL